MIQIKNLEAKVKDTDKQILNGVSLNFELGKNYCLLWKNGSGKSTLSAILAWSPKYQVTWGKIDINHPQPLLPKEGGEDVLEKHLYKENLLEMSPEERSRAWIFLAFQNVPEIPGIKLSEYLRTIYNIAMTPQSNSLQSGESMTTDKSEFKWLSPFLFKRFIKKYLAELSIDEKFLDRDLNVGFSWWEKRKIEILQMKLLQPKYIILDEIDSGLDLDAFKTVAKMLQSLSTSENTFIIITHYFTILDYLEVDEVFVMKDWEIAQSWGKELIDEIKKEWFN